VIKSRNEATNAQLVASRFASRIQRGVTESG